MTPDTSPTPIHTSTTQGLRDLAEALALTTQLLARKLRTAKALDYIGPYDDAKDDPVAAIGKPQMALESAREHITNVNARLVEVRAHLALLHRAVGVLTENHPSP